MPQTEPWLCSIFPDWLIDMLAAERRAEHLRWISFVSRPKPQPNPLPILMRALNGLWLRLQCIRQPCWKRGRWKSLT